jgi:hypothetical protein
LGVTLGQLFAKTPKDIYDALTSDSEFMSYVGTYTFASGNTTSNSITIMSPGQNLPKLNAQNGLEVIIHDAGDVGRMDYLTGDDEPLVTWKVFLIVWPPATGETMSNAAQRMVRMFGGAFSMETVSLSSGLGSLVQTMVLIKSNSPILV